MSKPRSNKYKVGPGGIHCPCCTKTHPRKMKIMERRLTRRASKHTLNTLTNTEE
jgi:hypothetical protein